MTSAARTPLESLATRSNVCKVLEEYPAAVSVVRLFRCVFARFWKRVLRRSRKIRHCGFCLRNTPLTRNVSSLYSENVTGVSLSAFALFTTEIELSFARCANKWRANYPSEFCKQSFKTHITQSCGEESDQGNDVFHDESINITSRATWKPLVPEIPIRRDHSLYKSSV